MDDFSAPAEPNQGVHPNGVEQRRALAPLLSVFWAAGLL
jgi:hypothetical protein